LHKYAFHEVTELHEFTYSEAPTLFGIIWNVINEVVISGMFGTGEPDAFALLNFSIVFNGPVHTN